MNVNVESHCKRLTLKSLEHEKIIILNAHNDLEIIEIIDLDKLDEITENELIVFHNKEVTIERASQEVNLGLTKDEIAIYDNENVPTDLSIVEMVTKGS